MFKGKDRRVLRVGIRTGEVTFLGVPVEMNPESESHERPSIWVAEGAPQLMRKPLGGGGGVWEREREKGEKRRRKMRDMVVVVVFGGSG